MRGIFSGRQKPSEAAKESLRAWREYDLVCRARDAAERKLETATRNLDESRGLLIKAIQERDEARAELAKVKPPLYCSFCGKIQYEVRKLIAGPTVFICDECVSKCVEIIDNGEGGG